MNKIISLLQPVIYPAIKWYYRKPRTIQKRGIRMQLNPSVFHPSYYLSTDIFLDFLLNQNLKGKRVLELGTGNGFTALYLAKFETTITYASDINPNAIEGIEINAKSNQVEIQSFLSDLFDDIPFLELDHIIVNPPYFSKEVSSVDEYAFFTGPNFAYFHKFFEQVKPYLRNQTKVWMILSENTKMSDLTKVGEEHSIKMTTIYEEVKKGELFLIYELKEKQFS